MEQTRRVAEVDVEIYKVVPWQMLMKEGKAEGVALYALVNMEDFKAGKEEDAVIMHGEKDVLQKHAGRLNVTYMQALGKKLVTDNTVELDDMTVAMLDKMIEGIKRDAKDDPLFELLSKLGSRLEGHSEKLADARDKMLRLIDRKQVIRTSVLIVYQMGVEAGKVEKL